jgi:CelD/BcsL family acetyltransferase involved in cellulose biosynthesis
LTVPVVHLVTDPAALAAERDEWDELAVRSGRPYCGPAWLMAWWRRLAPPNAGLRVLLVRDAGTLIGVAPFFTDRTVTRIAHYRLLGGPLTARIEPLAAVGRERDVAHAITEGLSASSPRPAVLELDGSPMSSPWPQLIVEHWPGARRPRVLLRTARPAPTLDLRGKDFDSWFMSKTKHFRQRMRKDRKDFDAAGGRFRLSGSGDLEHDLAAFARLHHAGWRKRGGSRVLTQGVERMLLDVARELTPSGRFRLWSLELGDEIVSSHIIVTAGDEWAYWLTGSDTDRAVGSPTRLGILNTVEDAIANGASRLDLGDGSQPYKYRFSDSEDWLQWLSIAPCDRRYPLTRLGLLPKQLNSKTQLVANRLPPRIKGRLRQVRYNERRVWQIEWYPRPKLSDPREL